MNTYRTFKSSIIYLDGGMCANPYKIAYYAKLMESDQKEILENVHLSRAFTVYQLTTLIQHMLENSIRRYHPQTLIVGNLPVLFFDPDITTREARVLLKNNLDKLKELTVRYNLITVFTSLDKKMMLGTRNLRKTLYSGVDEIIKLKQREKRIDVNIVKKQIKTTILCFSKGQLRLQDFGMVIQ